MIQAKASVSKAYVPSTTYRTRYATVYGLILPRHYTAGSTRIYFEHWEAYKGKYQWRYKFYRTASLTSSGSYAKASTVVKFPYAGKWRVYVRHADTSHYATYGSYGYTTTR